MKKSFLDFLRKYWICILLGLLIVLGHVLAHSLRYVLYEINIAVDLFDAYCIVIVPLLSLLYGSLSYIVTKRVWTTQLILFVIICPYWLWFTREIASILLLLYPALFSLIGTLLFAYIYHMIRLTRQK